MANTETSGTASGQKVSIFHASLVSEDETRHDTLDRGYEEGKPLEIPTGDYDLSFKIYHGPSKAGHEPHKDLSGNTDHLAFFVTTKMYFFRLVTKTPGVWEPPMESGWIEPYNRLEIKFGQFEVPEGITKWNIVIHGFIVTMNQVTPEGCEIGMEMVNSDDDAGAREQDIEITFWTRGKPAGKA